MLHSVSYLIQFLDRTSHGQVQTVESHLCNVKHRLLFMVKGQLLCISEERKRYRSILLLNGHNDFFCFQARLPKGPTVPKPFNLSQGNKRKLEETTSEYVSLAEQVEAFQRRTPSRYHLRSRKSEEGEQSQLCPASKLSTEVVVEKDALVAVLSK